MEDQTKLPSRECSEIKLRKAISDSLTLSVTQTALQARFENQPIKAINEDVVKVTLLKVIGDTLDYFGQKDDAFVDLLIQDIMYGDNDVQSYRNWTLVDIIKAFAMGRAKTTELYGKLAGHHFRGWLQEYDRYLDEKIAEHRRNEKIAVQRDEIDIREAYRNWKLPEKNRTIPGNGGPVVMPADDRTRLVREWEDLEGDKPSLEDFVKSRQCGLSIK